MPDQNYARSRRDVTVIRDVQQKFARALILNPGMEDRHQRLEVDFLGIVHEQLHIDVLKFHGFRESLL